MRRSGVRELALLTMPQHYPADGLRPQTIRMRTSLSGSMHVPCAPYRAGRTVHFAAQLHGEDRR